MRKKLEAPGRMLGLAVLLALLVGIAARSAPAGEPAEKGEAAAKAPEKEPEKKPDFPPFDEVSADHEKMAGFFDLYYDKKKDHLLGVIPKSMVGKDFLILTSISGGPTATGFMWNGQVVQWREMDEKLVLIEPDLRYNPAEKSTVEDVVARTYTDRIVLSTEIVSKRGGDPVIDLDGVFKKDRAGIAAMYRASMDSSLSRWAKTKAFEKNVELSVDAALMTKGGGGTRARVHFSLSELPKNDYKPRRADDRIGYFMTARKNWGRDHNDRTVFDRYVHRWHLRKADPKAAVGDVHPDDQIIFYLEKTIPIKYRRYIREGILSWNKAFEKAGLLNAVAVRQQTDYNEFKDIDPEDVRYNFIRWIVSGRAFAMGPSRVNPRTGQILDADIVFDDSLIRALLAQYARMAAQGPAAAYDPQLQEFLANNPEWGFVPQEEQLTPGITRYGGVDMSIDNELVRQYLKNNQSACTFANGIVHEMAFADFILRSEGGGGLSEKYIGEFIRFVSAHEVGHTLGLRHNFKASSWKPLDEIIETSGDRDAPTVASVMDYCPAMFATELDDQKNFYGAGLGPYDEWAIRYGYAHPDDEHKTEAELLKAIASQSAEPGHVYGTDEDRMFFAPDPLVNVYDNSDDPIGYAKYRMELVKKLQNDMDSWAIEDGESYSRLRRAFDALLFEYGRVSQFAARFVGGQYVARNHKGDPDEVPPFTIVPVSKQREALDFLVENVFADDAFDFDPALVNKMGPGRWGHWDSDDYDSQRDYPLHDRIAAAQYWALFHLINPFTVTRVHDAELKVPADEDALTVPELFAKTTKAVWSEMTENPGATRWTNRNPFVSSVRRTLQRTHLKLMINVLLSAPGSTMPADAHAVTRLTLTGLSQQIGDLIGDGQGKKLDSATRAHLDEAKARIDRALEAEFKL